MTKMSRRDMYSGLSIFALMPTLVKAQGADVTDMATSKVFHFDSLPATKHANGGEGRAVVKGTLPTGEYVEVHYTVLPPGEMPHPPHKHPNSEFLLIEEGKLEYLTMGKSEIVGAHDIIFTASNQPHGLRNVGTTPARYFVVSVGKQAKPIPTPLTPPTT